MGQGRVAKRDLVSIHSLTSQMPLPQIPQASCSTQSRGLGSPAGDSAHTQRAGPAPFCASRQKHINTAFEMGPRP